jgi:hypothetical protein
MLAAALHAVEARGQALLCDASATRRAMLEAERRYERIRPDAEPPSIHYAEGQFAADLGRCLRDVGDSTQGIRLFTRAVEANAAGRVRSRCIMEADLTAAHLVGRDYEQAAALGRDAVRTAAQLSSTRALDRLRTLHHQIQPLRHSSPHLAELDDRITDLFTASRVAMRPRARDDQRTADRDQPRSPAG